MALDFTNSKSNNMVNTVFKRADSIDIDNKKRDIDIKLIDPNPDNEYIFGHDDIDYLASEINEDGFNGAIEVYAKSDGRYEICSGHRRYLAAVQEGMTKIPCIVSKDTDATTKARRLIMSNIQQRKMTPLKWARSLEYYDKKVLSATNQYKGRKRDELAKAFNISGTTVHRYMALLKLIPEFQELADVPHFPYFNLYELTNLDVEQQKIMYERLMKMSEDGDLSKMSKAIIDQQVRQLKGELEKKQEEKRIFEKQEEISRQVEAEAIAQAEDNEYSTHKGLEDTETNKTEESSSTMLSKEETLDAKLDTGIVPFESSFMGENDMTGMGIINNLEQETIENEAENELDNQFKYFLNRIESLVDEPQVLNNKELVNEWAKSLEELLKKMHG